MLLFRGLEMKQTSVAEKIVPPVAAIVLVFGSASAAPLSFSSTTLTVVKTCVLTGTPSTSTAVKDAGVQQANKTTKYGTATTMAVSSSLNANQRLHVQFDLTRCSPALPASAAVWSATLRLFVTAIPATCRTQDIFAVTASWSEATVTWNSQPFGQTLNNPPSAQRNGSFDVGLVSCQNTTANQYVTASVLSNVQTWVAGTSTNNGWMIRDDVEDSAVARTATYTTKDANTASQAPQLIISYST
jgi:hypothetical protein